MKFYSENTKKLYDTITECEKADKEFLAEQDKKLNAENEAKSKLDAYMRVFNEKNEAVKKANSELAVASRELSNAVTEFNRKYHYVPDAYRSVQLLSWLL